MKNIYKIGLVLLIAMFTFAACGGVGRRPRPVVSDDPRTSGEANFDPLGFSGDLDIVTKDVAPGVDSEESSELPPPAKKAAPAKHASQHYAVQVFASKSSSEAKDFQNSIEPIFQEEIAVDYQAPYYRVCVGKCAGYDDAEALLKKVNAMGFPKAWLVKLRK
jgi:hypothetical protein